jgi:serine/threonine protein kinase
MSDLIGKSLGRYLILEQIGRGGMATVYKALDTTLDRYVAIKLIRHDAFPPNHFDLILKRFLREARALAKLSHPNILKIYDYGEFENQPYLVMEYIGDGTLKDMLKDKTIPWQEALQVLTAVARALDAAHSQGIIHRDVKPSNILMANGRNPMLSDFGIAKIISSAETEADITGTGIGIGTPEYMAPEQGKGEADERSDIYSLGVVFYQMITGHKPFEADTPLAVWIKKTTEPLPSPKNFVHDLPASVEIVLLKALAREPKKRYRNMNEFAIALDSLWGSAGNLATVVDTGEFSEFSEAEDRTAEIIGKRLLQGPKDKEGNWVSRLSVFFRRLFTRLKRKPISIEQPQLEAIRRWKESGTMTVNIIAVLEPQRQKHILTLINREHELRIKDILVHFGGGRYLLHGFGRFGASALIDQIVEQARSDTKNLKSEKSLGIILMVRAELNDLDDNDKVFRAIVRDFRFEAERERYAKPIAKRLRRIQNNSFARVSESTIENTISIKASPIPGLETAFSRKSDKTINPTIDTTSESGIIDAISQFLDHSEDKKQNIFEKMVERIANNTSAPSRVIIVLDKISSDKVFKVLQGMRLFSDERITFFAVVREEEFIKWDSSVRQMINNIGFREYYVPCIWEEEHHLAQEMVKLSLSANKFFNETAIDFVNHVAYKSRGAPGDMVKELVDPIYNVYETGTPQLRLDSLRDKKVILFNSMLQKFLASNWNKILGDDFLGLKDTDRAKMGVYELMDWMTQQVEFNQSDLEQSLPLGKVSISHSAALRRDVAKRLLEYLVEDGLLTMNQDLYRVVVNKKIQDNAQAH